MTSEKLSQLSEQELMEEAKKQKKILRTFALILCLMTGVAIYSATHKGSFIISCLPLFFMPTLVILDKNYKAVKAEIQARNNQ